MKHNIFIKIALATLTISAMTACQDIKDTFSDWAGDGEIRYIGMCDNLTVSPGWKRLMVNWTNNVDPVIEKVKVKWASDNMADSVLLDRGTEEYNITNLDNETYSITVSSLDKDGRSSMENTIYSRPYTSEHEEVMSFTRVIAKHFFLGNNLVLEFSGWQDGLESAILKYTKKDDTAGEIALNKDIVSKTLYSLPDQIDPSKPVVLYRTGRIGSCSDLITFDPYELQHVKSYTSDFKEFIKTKYGLGSTQISEDGNINDAWANNVETLEIDNNLNSLEDILNMPKLKKLIIGKNTYLTERGANDEERGQYKLSDPTTSNTAIELMHKISGLQVERYNKHYQGLLKASYVTDKGAATLPSLNYYDLSKATASVYPEDMEGYNSHPNYLFDGNLSSCWKPLATSSQQTYIITMDLGKEVEASGVCIVQKNFSETDQDEDIAPSKIGLQYADKSGGFKDATYVTDNYIGTSTGQTIVLPFAGGKKTVRYLKISIPSQAYFGNFDATLAEVRLYK